MKKRISEISLNDLVKRDFEELREDERILLSLKKAIHEYEKDNNEFLEQFIFASMNILYSEYNYTW